jgi:hypothetical protein
VLYSLEKIGLPFGLLLFLLEKKMVNATLWKTESDVYSIQFDRVKPKDKKEIKEIFKKWKQIASGFHRDGSELFIFSKKILENEDVYKFVKQLPYPVKEEKKNGETKVVKTQFNHTKSSKPLTSPKNHAKIAGGRTCSRCGQKGHNSRTCNDLSQ